MFGKKKKEAEKAAEANKQKQAILSLKASDYTKWADDLGFLLLIIQQNIAIVEKYIIDVSEQQLSDKTFLIRDSDIQDEFKKALNDSFNMLSKSYVDYLSNKYFNTVDHLLEWMGEYIYNSLVDYAVTKNFGKISNKYSSDMGTKILSNNGPKDEQITNVDIATNFKKAFENSLKKEVDAEKAGK